MAHEAPRPPQGGLKCATAVSSAVTHLRPTLIAVLYHDRRSVPMNSRKVS